jgi:hypothetical protein
MAPTGDRTRRDRDRYLLETSVPGIFACGDARFSPVKRVTAVVGEGMAVAFVHQYLREHAACIEDGGGGNRTRGRFLSASQRRGTSATRPMIQVQDSSPVSTISARSSSAVARTSVSGSLRLRDSLRSFAAARAIAEVSIFRVERKVRAERLDLGYCYGPRRFGATSSAYAMVGNQQLLVLVLGENLHRRLVKRIVGIEKCGGNRCVEND